MASDLPSAPNTIRSRVEWALREEGLTCKILFEASSTALLFAAVMAKLGVTVLPWTAAHVEVDEGKLKLAKLNHSIFRRELSLCWRDTPLVSNAVLKVKDTMRELVATLSTRPEWAAGSGRRARRSKRTG